MYINRYTNIDLCAFPPVNPSTDPRSCITRHGNKGLAEGTELFPSIHLQPWPGSRCATLGTHWVFQAFCNAWHLEKQRPHQENTASGLFQEWRGREWSENQALPLSAIHRGKLRGQNRGAVRFLSFPEWSSPGEGLEGEGAVFFFCPNNLMKFGSSAGGIEISSRYTVCLCLINVNLPRAPSTPRAPALH